MAQLTEEQKQELKKITEGIHTELRKIDRNLREERQVRESQRMADIEKMKSGDGTPWNHSSTEELWERHKRMVDDLSQGAMKGYGYNDYKVVMMETYSSLAALAEVVGRENYPRQLVGLALSNWLDTKRTDAKINKLAEKKNQVTQMSNLALSQNAPEAHEALNRLKAAYKKIESGSFDYKKDLNNFDIPTPKP